MKKFIFMFLIAATALGAASFVFAAEHEGEGEKKFVIHGEVRQRAEMNDNLQDFTEDTDDSYIFFPYRARVAAEGHFMKNVVGYVEFQAFGQWGDGHPSQGGSDLPFFGDNEFHEPVQFPIFAQDFTTNDSNEIRLYQAFIGLNNIADSNFSLKIGRQEIVRGSEMLLGDLDFYNGLVHDAAMASWDWEGFSLDVWGSRAFQNYDDIAGDDVVFDFGFAPDHQNAHFWGAWAQWDEWENGADVAAYVLYYEYGLQSFGGGVFNALPDSARRAFYTLGGRTGREEYGENGFNWNAEFAYQTGDQNNGPSRSDNKDIKASAFEATLGYTWHTGSASADHEVHVTVASASGDDDSNTLAGPTVDSDAEAFDPLFQDFHGRYGLADIFRFTNLEVISAGYKVRIGDHWFGGDVWKFTAAEKYLLESDPTKQEDDLASEIDLWWKFQYSENAQIMVGAGFVKAGDLLEDFVEFDGSSPSGVDASDGLRLVSNLRLRF